MSIIIIIISLTVSELTKVRIDEKIKKCKKLKFLIAKKMDLTINQTRNILYKLADEGLVGFIRKKDKKKGGWYTYFWTLRMKKSLIRYKEELVNKLENIKTQLNTRETERHYFCKNCELEYNEESAMHQEFTCAECGEVLEIRETEKITTHLRNEIRKLEEEILRVDQEIEVLEDKEQKGNERKLKAEKKKKEKGIAVEDVLVDDILTGDIEEATFENIDSESVVGSGSTLSISQVIQLVRSLPQQGTEVELHAVLRTLELFDIDIRKVLEDSYRKESITTQRIETLFSEISTLDDEIEKRANEIKMLEVGITEMARVNECLELMLKLDDELLEAALENQMSDSVPTIEAPAQESQKTLLKKKSAAEELDDYVKEGKTETLDGIIIDLDSPPKKHKLKSSKKSKSKRKSKAVATQDA